MVSDRAGGIEAVMAIGNELLPQVAPAEKQQIEFSLDELSERWSDVRDCVNQRQAALNSAMAVAKEFHDNEGPLVEWLDRTEKKVTALDNTMQAMGADTCKIDAQTEQQKALNADVIEHKINLDDVLISGQNLVKHCSEEDGAVLQVRRVKELLLLSLSRPCVDLDLM